MYCAGLAEGAIMIDVDMRTRRMKRADNRTMPARPFPFVSGARRVEEATAQSCVPTVQVSELDGMFNVYADFTMVPDAEHVTVEFAQQGIIVSGGTIQRYIPIPTDGDIELAKVRVTDRVARISIPTAGLGHRWRAIVMW
jgi:hypothetical protein